MKLVVINGFLGSGKTTMLLHLISQLKMVKIALIVNEFGHSSYDAKILRKFDMELEEVKNGSIFCSCKSDEFAQKLSNLLLKDFDWIFIESSGFSNPVALEKIINFSLDHVLSEIPTIYYLTIVDPVMFPKLIHTLNSYQNQIDIADTLILNKMDLVTEEASANVRDQLALLNKEAEIIMTSYGHVKVDEILSLSLNHLDRKPVYKKSLQDSSLSIRIEGHPSIVEIEGFLRRIKEKIYRLKGTYEDYFKKYSIQVSSMDYLVVESDFADNEMTILYSTKLISTEDLLKEIEETFDVLTIIGHK